MFIHILVGIVGGFAAPFALSESTGIVRFFALPIELIGIGLIIYLGFIARVIPMSFAIAFLPSYVVGTILMLSYDD